MGMSAIEFGIEAFTAVWNGNTITPTILASFVLKAYRVCFTEPAVDNANAADVLPILRGIEKSGCTGRRTGHCSPIIFAETLPLKCFVTEILVSHYSFVTRICTLTAHTMNRSECYPSAPTALVPPAAIVIRGIIGVDIRRGIAVSGFILAVSEIASKDRAQHPG